MAVSPTYRQLAIRFGLVQAPGVPDPDFVQLVKAEKYQRDKLHAEARACGAVVREDMSSTTLRAIVIERQRATLKERGFVSRQHVKVGDRILEITKIAVAREKYPKLWVHYWVVSPWMSRGDSGRHNQITATEMLRLGQIAPRT